MEMWKRLLENSTMTYQCLEDGVIFSLDGHHWNVKTNKDILNVVEIVLRNKQEIKKIIWELNEFFNSSIE